MYNIMRYICLYCKIITTICLVNIHHHKVTIFFSCDKNHVFILELKDKCTGSRRKLERYPPQLLINQIANKQTNRKKKNSPLSHTFPSNYQTKYVVSSNWGCHFIIKSSTSIYNTGEQISSWGHKGLTDVNRRRSE